MEDAVDVKDDVAGFRMFTVYDGHAGDEAVTVVKKILPDILETHLEKEGDVEKAICLAFRHIDEELVGAFRLMQAKVLGLFLLCTVWLGVIFGSKGGKAVTVGGSLTALLGARAHSATGLTLGLL